MRLVGSVLALSSCMLASACRTSATPGTAAHIADSSPQLREIANTIELCKTTEADLRAQLREPFRQGRLGDERILSWVDRGKEPERFLAVLLDDRGVVVDVYWDVPGAVAWAPTDHCRSAPPTASSAS